MRITTSLVLNLKVPEVKRKVNNARRTAVKDTIVAIANDVIKIHPWKNKTGNNSRSIKYELEGDGSGGAVFSTSGYGGILETGSSFMPAFPYFKPALDRNIHKLPEGIKASLK